MRISLVLFCVACLKAQAPFSGAAAVDQQMERAVQDGLIPGGVVLIGHNGQVVYQKAYGSRALIPHREPMTPLITALVTEARALATVMGQTSAAVKNTSENKPLAAKRGRPGAKAGRASRRG